MVRLLLAGVIAVAGLSTAATTALALAAARANYPGGEALQALHRAIDAETRKSDKVCGVECLSLMCFVRVLLCFFAVVWAGLPDFVRPWDWEAMPCFGLRVQITYPLHTGEQLWGQRVCLVQSCVCSRDVRSMSVDGGEEKLILSRCFGLPIQHYQYGAGKKRGTCSVYIEVLPEFVWRVKWKW